LQAPKYRAVTQQQHGRDRHRQSEQQPQQHAMVLLAARAGFDQQHQTHGGKQVHHDQRQYDFHDNAGAGWYRGETSPQQQSNSRHAAAHAGHR